MMNRAIETNRVHRRAFVTGCALTAAAFQWMWDGVHPLPQGHELIARNWLNEVSARWPEGSSD